MIRLGVLGSTRGTNLTALVDAIAARQLIASLDVVISNKPHAGILEKAANFGLAHYFVDPFGLSREQFDDKLSLLLGNFNVDLVVLIGYMRLLSKPFVINWANKIINIHPSLLPKYGGLMDLHVHQAVLNANEQETGCSVHVVTEHVDAGPIILQKKCLVLPDDTAESLKTRVQHLEGSALVEAIQKITV